MRWWILLLLLFSLALNIVDRQVLSLVAPVMRDELGISNTQYSIIVASLLAGMMLWQIPAGIMLDRVGARRGLAAIVGLWSLVTGLHALARSLVQFSALRFLLGMTECGNYSAGVKVIGQWFPARQRALAGGIFNSGSILGAILAPPLVVTLVLRYGWRNAFLITAVFGIVWIVPWLMVYREPWNHPRLSQAERASARQPDRVRGGSEPLGSLLRTRAVWTVVLMRALGGPVVHFYWYWLPEYLKRERGLSMEMIGLLGWLPFFFGGLGNLTGGWMSTWLMTRGWSVDRARKTVFTGGTALCLASVLAPVAPNAGWAIAMICLASLGVAAYAANLIGLITDLFPQRILAQVTGVAGAGEGLVAACVTLLTGIVVDRYSYLPVFIGAGILPVLGLLSLFLILRRVEPPDIPQQPIH